MPEKNQVETTDHQPVRPRLPAWLRRPLRTDGAYRAVHGLLERHALHTVCESAKCPNRRECWCTGTATFMILGDACTRHCAFCGVSHVAAPEPPDPDEPRRVAAAAQAMKLKHVVITSVTRDDLPDGGADQFAATIAAVRTALPAATVEVLTPDFQGAAAALETVFRARPDVFNHNLETVRRLQPVIRPQASQACSLAVLRYAADWEDGQLQVKSGLMLGLGESDDEVRTALHDLFAAGCRIITLGQYLPPSPQHPPPARYVRPEEFDALAAEARALGFVAVTAGALVRSSYHAAGQSAGLASSRLPEKKNNRQAAKSAK